jgi:hypothetical protein
MTPPSWSRLSRGAQLGALVALAALLPFLPFLAYAGLAVMNASAEWARSAGSNAVAVLVGFAVYLLLVVAIPVALGGLVGTALQRMRTKAQERGV